MAEQDNLHNTIVLLHACLQEIRGPRPWKRTMTVTSYLSLEEDDMCG